MSTKVLILEIIKDQRSERSDLYANIRRIMFNLTSKCLSSASNSSAGSIVKVHVVKYTIDIIQRIITYTFTHDWSGSMSCSQGRLLQLVEF